MQYAETALAYFWIRGKFYIILRSNVAIFSVKERVGDATILLEVLFAHEARWGEPSYNLVATPYCTEHLWSY